MKKLIFTIILLELITLNSLAQDSSLVEQYCNLIVTGKMFSNKVNIIIDFGKEEMKWNKDQRIKDEQTGKAIEFTSVIDALNYMGKQGWMLINAFPMNLGATTVSQPGTNTFYYYFKKLFKRSELD